MAKKENMGVLDMDRLKEIADRLKAATPGEWELKTNGNTVKSYGIIAPTRKVCSGISTLTADAAFIVCAHNNMPYLLTRLRAAEAKNETLKDDNISLMWDVENWKMAFDKAEAEMDKAERDMKLIAGETNSNLVCSICKWNPNDMGCELDGSQFDDNGDCHFEYRR
jgi:hypothetical protein